MQYIRYIIISFLIACILIAVYWSFNTVKGFIGNSSKYTINANSASVVKQLQLLSRYETVSFTIEKIIDAGTNGGVLKEFFYGDRILLIAHGQVIAGFDLSTMTQEQVEVRDSQVTLILPPPQLLVTKLDSTKTRVYDRRQGILTHGDRDLETKARSAAEDSITKAACEEKILDEAAKNARLQLTALLKTAGFTTVIITIPPASC